MKTAMDYEDEEREAMTPSPRPPLTPPLCPLCGRRASERIGVVPPSPFLRECLDPLHDAGDWGPALLEACKELREQLSIAAHFVDVVSPYPMPLGWDQVVAQADEAIGHAKVIIAAAEGSEEEVHDDSK
jgi:hypothetical protein